MSKHKVREAEEETHKLSTILNAQVSNLKCHKQCCAKRVFEVQRAEILLNIH
jgi:hypothetical protein